MDENIKQVHVITCEPVTPIFLPSKPDTRDPNKGKIKIEIYILMCCSK